jgi:hypothetical protein
MWVATYACVAEEIQSICSGIRLTQRHSYHADCPSTRSIRVGARSSSSVARIYLRKMFSPEQQGFPGHRVRPQSGRDTYDISATEFFLSNIEHFCQVVPVNNICLHEDSSRITCVRVDELLCFGSKTKVGDYYVAFVLEQQFGKGEIDASRRSAAAFKCSQ